MKSGRFLLATMLIILSFSLCVFCGCSTDAVTGTAEEEVVETVLSVLSVEASPNAISLNEATTVEAIAYDASGNEIEGVEVSFTLDDPTLAYVTASAVTDENGVAQVSLTSRGIAGEVDVTATAKGVSSDPPATVYIQEGVAPSQIVLTVTPSSITTGGATSVRAQVLDANDLPVSDGTTVSFASNNTAFGDFNTSIAVTTNGFANATFTAETSPGTATITVQCKGISAQATIAIFSADANSVEFVSADPQRIPIRGSGGIETSVIQFQVKDGNGNPLSGEPIYFNLSGPNGDEYITPTQSSTDENGLAEVILHSGSVAGPATIQASITTDSGVTRTSQSSVVSIGGGVPSAKRFSVAAEKLGLPGLAENGVETNITAYLADRFGNYNMLAGTTVSFVTEQGLAIDANNVTVDENGTASVVAYTQYPAGSDTACEDVAEDGEWETDIINHIESTYKVTLPGNPRDGLCSVMVYTKGEEHFFDENGNGVYDAGEDFIDTAEAFIDYNDDGLRDDGSFDPFEEYIDSDPKNGMWDDKNGVWDSNKNIFTNFKILLTGQPYLIRSSDPSFLVPDGQTVYFSIIVCDRNGNFLNEGSTVTVTHEGAGEFGGAYADTEYVFPDTNIPGPLELVFYVADTATGTAEDPEEPFSVSIKVEWKGEYGTIETGGVVATGWVD